MGTPLLYIDENLRGLARWLRFLGIDTALAEAGARDREVLARARAEGRILYTRDRSLVSEGARLVREAHTTDQLRAVLDEVGRPPPERWFTRCVVCNRVLREVPPAQRGEGIPGEFDRYWRCDQCGRTYWRGSHYERTKRVLESV